MTKLAKTPSPDHDDFCPKARFWSAECSCGGDARKIVREAIEGFRQDLIAINAEFALHPQTSSKGEV